MIDYMPARIPNSDIPCYIVDSSFFVFRPDYWNCFPACIGDKTYFETIEYLKISFDLEKEDRLVFSLDDKFGFISTFSSSVIIPPVWDWVSKFHNGFALVNKGCPIPSDDDIAHETLPQRGKFGVIDLNGEIILDPIYNKITFPQNRVKENILFTAYLDDNIFIFDDKSKIVLQPQLI